MTAIVFDLDGTILTTDREYRDILANAIADVRGDAPAEWLETYDEAFSEHFSDFDSAPVQQAFGRIDGCCDPESYANALHEAEIASLSPPRNAHTDLERLADEFELGVLTNGVREWQLAKLRAYDLEGYFDAIVASYEVGAHKPDAAPYRVLEERLPADRYGLIGDSESDVDGAKHVGWSADRYEGGGFGALPEGLFRD
ncbi:HAD family hydrolase [Natrinema altunense]|uniref:HAD-superfamily hydrolase n=1 Tax=Natrinema altunense (strain JCM 12890 / CGMCC 1.3731 / AJ2) TaxID=1227494 RepID=L9ZCH6_NATA2|nr:HAD family hydrolase [Natrinema altunense]ELY83706.1 HAD-superfamily hydrolase [Natrinema altunense JCM 12890]